MIINIRGTSGSGKTYLVKHIMSLYDNRIPFHQEGRKRPLGYLCEREGETGLAVIGHYETPCGGCDTIPTLDYIFELVREWDRKGYDVLFEGLLVNSDRNRTVQLHEDGMKLFVVTLATPIQECLDSVMIRRTARAEKSGREPKPLNPRNTESKYKLAKKNHEKFSEAGLNSVCYTRDMAIELLPFVLGL